MNYYYELEPAYDGLVFGERWRYWCMPNCSPAEGGKMCFKTHDEFVAHSHKVWLENANGVYLIKPAWAIYRGHVDTREFTMVKLRARTIKWWADE